MGLFLLVLFVGGSLAFTLWASHEEDAGRLAGADAPDAANEKKTFLVVALLIVTFFSGFLSELLRYSYRLSLVLSGAISLVVLLVGEWLAVRFFGQRRAKS
jgi:energy-converting hydrogenase Eha subunit F